MPPKKSNEEIKKIVDNMNQEIQIKSKPIAERYIKQREDYRGTPSGKNKTKSGNILIRLQDQAQKEYRKIWVEAHKKYGIAQGRDGLYRSKVQFRSDWNKLIDDKKAPKKSPTPEPPKQIKMLPKNLTSTEKEKDNTTSAIIRKLIRAHNVLSKIKVPVGLDKEGLIKFLDGKGYTINRKNPSIVKNKLNNPTLLKDTDKILEKPKPTEQQIKKKNENKEKKLNEQKKKDKVQYDKGFVDGQKSSKTSSPPTPAPKPTPKPEPNPEPKKTDWDKVTPEMANYKELEKQFIPIPNETTSKYILNFIDKNKKLFISKPKDSKVIQDWDKSTKRLNGLRLKAMIYVEEDNLNKIINNYGDVKKVMKKLNDDQQPIFRMMSRHKELSDNIQLENKTNFKPKVLFTAKLKKQYEEDMGDVKAIINEIMNEKNIKKQ